MEELLLEKKAASGAFFLPDFPKPQFPSKKTTEKKT